MVVNRQAGESMFIGHPGVFPLDTFGSLFCYDSASSVIVALAQCWSPLDTGTVVPGGSVVGLLVRSAAGLALDH